MIDDARRNKYTVQQKTDAATMAPGDEAPPGAPGTGEDMCPACAGSGNAAGGECEKSIFPHLGKPAWLDGFVPARVDVDHSSQAARQQIDADRQRLQAA